ncbi:Signal transduction histidine kinase [Pustulibacterium marinum]|uniref:histidine kinase n=1 Tax=Pustulibacterium marinum TaxID=1224947 RepID=A0A1I7HTS7_9FLAO|nr:HAMP domain-containing sensor histidine kinase [Pustulibacterium marinum]SFU64148.1 Signal transduction histidine kinase [Pustulibacterium marinum]
MIISKPFTAWDINGNMDKTKLLNKTTRSFLSYAIVILLASAPVFYYISEWLYVYETDEVLIFHKQDFVKNSRSNFSEAELQAWNKYNHNIEIVPDMGIQKDSIVGISIFDSTSQEKEPFRILYAPVTLNGKKYTYIEKSNLVEMEGMVISIALMFLCIIFVLFIGIIYISRASAVKIWKPFYDTLHKIRAFEIDKNREPHFVPTDIAEFDSLNKSIEKLIEKNTSIYQSQREFVENAAHELQTPLTLFQTKVDILAQSEGLSDEATTLIDSLNQDIARMNRLNKNLLLLSKITNDSYLEKARININILLEKNLDFFKEQGASKNLSIELDLQRSMYLTTNTTLAEVLINNLFMNAIRHNLPNGNIYISTDDRQLIFANSGSQSLEHPEKLFNRFSKENPSSQGNGLGLAIIKQIVEINGWDINYLYKHELHYFVISFQ